MLAIDLNIPINQSLLHSYMEDEVFSAISYLQLLQFFILFSIILDLQVLIPNLKVIFRGGGISGLLTKNPSIQSDIVGSDLQQDMRLIRSYLFMKSSFDFPVSAGDMPMLNDQQHTLVILCLHCFVKSSCVFITCTSTVRYRYNVNLACSSITSTWAQTTDLTTDNINHT